MQVTWRNLERPIESQLLIKARGDVVDIKTYENASEALDQDPMDDVSRVLKRTTC